MIEKIYNILFDAVENHKIPGASYGLFKDNQLKTGYVGFRQLEPVKEKALGNEIYDVASLSKVISTTTLVLKMVELKKIKFDDQVVQYLPRFKHQDITIKDLLAHQSGLPADIRNAKDLMNEQMVMDKIYDMDLVYQTKESIVYSDVGFILLGKIVEVVSNETLDVLANKLIFEPLGMKHTSYHPNKALCAPTEFRDDSVFKGLLKGLVHDEKAFALGGVSGHAGLFSTAYDIGLFMKAILTNEFVLNEASINFMFEPVITKSVNDILVTRTYGWLKPYSGGIAGDYHDFNQTIGHTGFTGCHMFIDRKNQIGFVLLSNAVHPKRSMNQIFSYRNVISNLIYKKR